MTYHNPMNNLQIISIFILYSMHAHKKFSKSLCLSRKHIFFPTKETFFWILLSKQEIITLMVRYILVYFALMKWGLQHYLLIINLENLYFTHRHRASWGIVWRETLSLRFSPTLGLKLCPISFAKWRFYWFFSWVNL